MALYIHIPFCEKKCDYCDFYSLPVKKYGRLLDSFAERLCDDIDGQLKMFGITEVMSVYIGGGTPSLLGARRIKELLDFLAVRLKGFPPPAEFTVEANPESLDADFLRACREGGVTRISCGIQAFDEASRRAVGRQGDISRLHAALALLNEVYRGAFSADIISGLPYQDESALLGGLKTLLSYGPAHVSLYDLTLEKDTPLRENILSSKITPLRPEAAERLWIAGRDFLEAEGYPQYEVSNFAPDASRSAHNIAYWRMESWLGAGPSASGTVIACGSGETETSGLRRVVKADVSGYVSGATDGVSVETLDSATLIRETVLMGFRYIEGPDRALFEKRFGRAIESLIPRSLEKWRANGKTGDDGFSLNRDGLLTLNSFLTDCFMELDETA